MDTKPQRQLRAVNPLSPIPEIMAAIAKALVGDGPALGFGEIASTSAPAGVCIVVGTSGSTGARKEVGLSARALLSSAKASNAFLGAQFGQSWSLLLPLTHIAGVNVLIRAMELGTIPFDLNNCAGEFPEVDFTAIVPTQLFRALNGDERLLKHLQSTRAVLVGGAALSRQLKAEAQAHDITVISTYGMTETSGGCVYNGEPLDGVQIEITSNKLIKISGPFVATTYLNDESGWSERCVDGWFLTSDIGEIKNGRLEIQGRADGVIISGGENISLSAIENSIAKKFPKIQCAAFAVKDEYWGQSLQLAIVGEINELELNNYLEENLGAFAKPKAIHVLKAMPLTALGKIDRSALAQLVSHE